jgi:hypothetical protein
VNVGSDLDSEEIYYNLKKAAMSEAKGLGSSA